LVEVLTFLQPLIFDWDVFSEICRGFLFHKLAMALGVLGRPQDEFGDIGILKSEPDIDTF
jgi:hypothetical protein